jgi:hypothetical protein
MNKQTQEALKIAIEYFEFEQKVWVGSDKENYYAKPITACKEALQQEVSEQEPVAWMAVDEISGEYMLEKEKDNGIEWTPLYTSPQAREWQGLSDSELEDLKYEYNHGGNGYSIKDIINIACSWLKEKNTPHTNQE